jgi:hypothetical protein
MSQLALTVPVVAEHQYEAHCQSCGASWWLFGEPEPVDIDLRDLGLHHSAGVDVEP